MLPAFYFFASACAAATSLRHDARHCASKITHGLPIYTYLHSSHQRSRPTLKMRFLSFASVFGLLSSPGAVPPSADTYLSTELPVAKAGLLANIGPNGFKASGAEVCCILMPGP